MATELIEEDSVSLTSDLLYKEITTSKESLLDNELADNLIRTLSQQIKNQPNSLLGFLLDILDQPNERYIKLPYYRNLHKRKLRDDEFLLKENGKYGILLNIVSNRKSFNFSVRLKDMTIIKYNYTLKKLVRGSFRSFTLTDQYGNISDIWKTLKVFELDETKKIFDNHSRSIRKECNVFVGDEIGNKLFDIEYFLLKLYIERLIHEREYWEEILDQANKRIENFDADYEKKKIVEEIKQMEIYHDTSNY